MSPEEYITDPTPQNQTKLYISAICDADMRNRDKEINEWASKDLTTLEYIRIQYDRLSY